LKIIDIINSHLEKHANNGISLIEFIDGVIEEFENDIMEEIKVKISDYKENTGDKIK
jgi:hypothetical protein